MAIELRNSYFPLTERVKQTLCGDFTDHRSSTFMKYIADLELLFCNTFNTKFCTFLQGSGTLANEVMLNEIKKKHEYRDGLILNHGEFGRRLVTSARLRHLNFYEITTPYDLLYDHIRDSISAGGISWILFPFCESSTGVVYSLERIKELIPDSIDIYIDGMSYIGNSPVDLSRVSVFTGSSGKGLGSLPGIGIVLHNEWSERVSNESNYLNLDYYHSKNNVPFTISTLQIKALGSSCRERLCDTNYQRISNLGNIIRKSIENSTIICLEYEDLKHLAFFSFSIDLEISSEKLGEFLESRDIYTSFRTQYLIDKNCIEIALLDYNLTQEKLEILFKTIEEYGSKK